ncbi:MAG: hypothetical protein WBB67_14380 [bacterium]
MRRLIFCFLILFCISFADGVKPSFSMGAGWSYTKPSGYSGNHFVDIGIGTTAPFSRYIGLRASVFGVSLGGGGTSMGVSGRMGLIEMIPTGVVSPYFKQYVYLDHMAASGDNLTYFGVGLGIGMEFLNNFHVSPYVSGNFGFSIIGASGYDTDTAIGFGAGGGVRFSWKK